MPGQAQPVAADLLPAYEVTTIIASMGMHPVGRPAWMRGRYVVAAIDRHGREVNVVLDARDGQVLAVRPLGRNSFGPPPPGYAARPASHDPMDDGAPPPAAGPGAPPTDEGEFFDNDQQHGLLPPRPPVRTAVPQRDPSVTGSITRSIPAERRDAAKDRMPVPRPRPALARANDPGNNPAAAPARIPAVAGKLEENKPDVAAKPAKAEAKAEVKPEASKPVTRQASKPQTVKPGQPKAEAASKTEAAKDVRVIDLSKPKTAPKPEDKPGVAIRF
jgi:hypothetical protein